MTKGLADDAKSDVCSWLSKAISLHESLPQLCHQRAPELLGEPGTGSTSASSAFLMSLSALLLRLGSWKFINADEKVCARGGCFLKVVGQRRTEQSCRCRLDMSTRCFWFSGIYLRCIVMSCSTVFLLLVILCHSH